MEGQSSTDFRNHILQALQEYRFELESAKDAISIRLVSGTAECFGMELALDVDYPFAEEARGAIFTWSGCELQIEYISEETPVPAYHNLHLALERLRVLAHSGQHASPRVLLIGEEECGKTSLLKTLANWAIRSGRARTERDPPPGEAADEGEGKSRGVLLVNLDTSEGALTMPGTITLAPLYTTLPSSTPVLPLGTTHATGVPPLHSIPSSLPQPNMIALTPALTGLSFWYGSTSWDRPAELGDLLLTQAGDAARSKLEMAGEDDAISKGGMLIDTPGTWADKGKKDIVQTIVRQFDVNVIVVVGSEKLHVEMTKLMSTNRSVMVVRVPKSGGVSDLDLSYQRRNHSRQIHSYFYGGPAYSMGKLSPHSINVRFEDLKIYRVGEEYQVPDSALPIGAERTTTTTQLVEVDPTSTRATLELVNQVLAIMQAPDDADDETTVGSPILGFVHISALDATKQKFTLLSPRSGRLPRRRAVLGLLDWQDSA